MSRSAAGETGEPGSWQLAFGTSASVVVSHADGPGPTSVGVMIPGWRGGNGNFLYSPAPFYVTFPVGSRLALEPSLDVHRSRFLTNSGVITMSATTVGLRVNYGFAGGWYAGASLVEIGKKGTGNPWLGITGAGVQGGCRFHLSGAWGGRLEVSHLMLARQRIAFEPPRM